MSAQKQCVLLVLIFEIKLEKPFDNWTYIFTLFAEGNAHVQSSQKETQTQLPIIYNTDRVFRYMQAIKNGAI